MELEKGARNPFRMGWRGGGGMSWRLGLVRPLKMEAFFKGNWFPRGQCHELFSLNLIDRQFEKA